MLSNDVKKILIVDDEDLIRESYAELLKEKGEFEVLFANSGNLAVELLNKDNSVDAVLSDYQMKDGDGITVLNKCRELGVPIIILTALSNKNIVIDIIKQKPFYFFDKSEPFDDIYNKLSEALIERDRFLEAKMYEKLGQRSAKMIHDLNNPLAIISGGLEILRLRKNDPTLIESTLQRIDQSAKRISNLIKETKMIVKEDGVVNYEPVNLLEFFNKFATDQQIIMVKNNCKINIENTLNFSPKSKIDPEQITRVFANLVENSVYALNQCKDRRKRQISITLAKGEFKQLEIIYKDTGLGIPDNIKEQLFQGNHFTSKPAGIGSGLGLDGCLEILESHLGSIKAGDCSNGAEFIIHIPLFVEETKTAA